MASTPSSFEARLGVTHAITRFGLHRILQVYYAASRRRDPHEVNQRLPAAVMESAEHGHTSFLNCSTESIRRAFRSGVVTFGATVAGRIGPFLHLAYARAGCFEAGVRQPLLRFRGWSLGLPLSRLATALAQWAFTVSTQLILRRVAPTPTSRSHVSCSTHSPSEGPAS